MTSVQGEEEVQSASAWSLHAVCMCQVITMDHACMLSTCSGFLS